MSKTNKTNRQAEQEKMKGKLSYRLRKFEEQDAKELVRTFLTESEKNKKEQNDYRKI